MTDKEQRAKAWCFDNGVTREQITTAWNNALAAGNMVIKNLHQHGHKWTILPEHLLSQLIENY